MIICNKYLQYKHMRRYMDFLEYNFVKVYSYKKYRRIRQENDYNIKKSFYNIPCMDPYKEYKIHRQLNEFKIKNIF